MGKKFDIDEQIKSIEIDIARLTQDLFEAKGMLRMAQHIKTMCDIKAKEGAIASSSPAGQ